LKHYGNALFALTHGVRAAHLCETHVSSILGMVHSCIYVRYISSLLMWKFHSEFAALRLLHIGTIKELNTLIYAAKILGTNKNQTTQE